MRLVSTQINPIVFALVCLVSTQAFGVSTVPSVDLTRYTGRWYEIASIPQFFQKKCVGDVTANYESLEPGQIRVTNSCRRSDGPMSVAEGRAKVVEGSSNAKLKVTFVKWLFWIYAFGGDYWIIDLDPEYHFAVIGHPERKYGWILSRSPQLNKAELIGIQSRLKDQGYDDCAFLMTRQGGEPAERFPLCDYLKRP